MKSNADDFEETHLDAYGLTAVLMRVLPEDQAAMADVHLQTCSACRDELAWARDRLAALKGLPPDPLPSLEALMEAAPASLPRLPAALEQWLLEIPDREEAREEQTGHLEADWEVPALPADLDAGEAGAGAAQEEVTHEGTGSRSQASEGVLLASVRRLEHWFRDQPRTMAWGGGLAMAALALIVVLSPSLETKVMPWERPGSSDIFKSSPDGDTRQPDVEVIRLELLARQGPEASLVTVPRGTGGYVLQADEWVLPIVASRHSPLEEKAYSVCVLQAGAGGKWRVLYRADSEKLRKPEGVEHFYRLPKPVRISRLGGETGEKTGESSTSSGAGQSRLFVLLTDRTLDDSALAQALREAGDRMNEPGFSLLSVSALRAATGLEASAGVEVH